MSRNETKKHIDFMLIDTDFFEKPENVEAVDKFGDLAPSAIMRLCLKLMNEQDATMRKSQVLAMWRASGTDQKVWAEIIEYYISCGWLVEQNECIRSARVGQERARVIQKRETLSANAKQKQSKCSAEVQQSESKSSDTDTDPEVLDLKKELAPGKIQPGDLKILEFDQIQWEALQVQNEKPVLDRAITLAEAYVDKHKKKDPQRYRELCDEAKSGKSYLISWPISEAMKQIKGEGAAQARLEKAVKPYEKPQEPPRPQPKVYEKPKVEAASPQAAAKFKQDLQGLIKGTTKAVSA